MTAADPALTRGLAELAAQRWLAEHGTTDPDQFVAFCAAAMATATTRQAHVHCDGDPNECSVQGLQGELAELRHQAKHVAAMLGIVLTVADTEPIAYDVAAGSGARCFFCDAMPPGAADTLARSQHQPGCTWLAACDLVAQLEADRNQAPT